MAKEISLIELMDDHKEWDEEKMEWIPFDEEEEDTIYEKFRNYVAATARGARRQRIYRTPIYGVKRWGILRRLTYDPDTKKVSYCCGQEWNSEMAVLRDAFD